MFDLKPDIITAIKNAEPTLKIYGSYPFKKPTFPCVIYERLNNTTYEETHDTAGNHHNEVSFQLNIYSNSESGSELERLSNLIDNEMMKFGFNRGYASEMGDMMFQNVRRFVLRYNYVLDENKKIYRR